MCRILSLLYHSLHSLRLTFLLSHHFLLSLSLRIFPHTYFLFLLSIIEYFILQFSPFHNNPIHLHTIHDTVLLTLYHFRLYFCFFLRVSLLLSPYYARFSLSLFYLLFLSFCFLLIRSLCLSNDKNRILYK